MRLCLIESASLCTGKTPSLCAPYTGASTDHDLAALRKFFPLVTKCVTILDPLRICRTMRRQRRHRMASEIRRRRRTCLPPAQRVLFVVRRHSGFLSGWHDKELADAKSAHSRRRRGDGATFVLHTVSCSHRRRERHSAGCRAYGQRCSQSKTPPSWILQTSRLSPSWPSSLASVRTPQILGTPPPSAAFSARLALPEVLTLPRLEAGVPRITAWHALLVSFIDAGSDCCDRCRSERSDACDCRHRISGHPSTVRA